MSHSLNYCDYISVDPPFSSCSVLQANHTNKSQSLRLFVDRVMTPLIMTAHCICCVLLEMCYMMGKAPKQGVYWELLRLSLTGHIRNNDFVHRHT